MLQKTLLKNDTPSKFGSPSPLQTLPNALSPVKPGVSDASDVTRRFDSIFTAKEEFIFVFGGLNSVRTINSVEVFDV